MSDHLDSPGLTSPQGNPKTDITDVYAFQKPGDERNKSILILNVNPLTLAPSFESQAVYVINVDTNADSVADVSFRIRFSDVAQDGSQTATVHLATGALAAGLNDGGRAIIAGAPVSFGDQATITESAPYRFFAGIRSDPFFFDLLGFINDLHFTGDDFFIDKNVFGIVLEVPNSVLGGSPSTTSLWARTLLSQSGTLVRDDRMGRPAINTVFNHGQDKVIFNSIDPAQDRTALTVEFNPDGTPMTFVQSFTNTLTLLGGSTGLVNTLLPDKLDYNFSQKAGYLNGRLLTDDVIDLSLQLVTGNSSAGDGVSAHTDYLSDFPYLGAPHPVAK
jgi:Domain of unknown function (DUF4331)